MGVYLLGIAIVDITYREMFTVLIFGWRSHIICKLLASIHFLSSELSLFMLSYISVYRAKITSSMRMIRNTGQRKTQLVPVCMWLVAILWTVIMFGTTFIEDGRMSLTNNLCLFFAIKESAFNGSQLASYIIYFIINYSCLLIIGVSYMINFFGILKSHKRFAHIKKESYLAFVKRVLKLVAFGISNTLC
jgi:hypothetical protein